jgi:hypothetical protein
MILHQQLGMHNLLCMIERASYFILIRCYLVLVYSSSSSQNFPEGVDITRALEPVSRIASLDDCKPDT